MKTFYPNKTNTVIKIVAFALFFLTSFSIQAQVEEEIVQDTVKGYNQASMQLDNPPSIIEAYTYDPVTNRYIYTNKVDEFNINYPIILTPKEYDELVLRESMRKYFKKKSEGGDR